MMNKKLVLPAILLAIALVLCVVSCFLTGIMQKPAITQHTFDFSVTYRLDGEVKTLTGSYSCQYTGHGADSYPLDRFYRGTFVTDAADPHPGEYTIAQKNGKELRIVVIFDDSLLMGDAEYDDAHYEPYLAVFEENGDEYDEAHIVGQFNAEIVSWEYPESVENTLVFEGFSQLHTESMLAMELVGLLTIFACILLVKREQPLPYQPLDKLSVLLNFAVVIFALPFITLVVALTALTINTDTILYQASLCIPALTALTIAASLCLRRKGFTKAGLFIQFVGPALFLLLNTLYLVL